MVTLAVIALAEPVSHTHEPIVIASGHGSLFPNQPQAAIGDSGRIHVVFGIADTVQYAGSTNGNTFEKSRLAFQVPNMALGMRRGPRIASTGDVIVVTAIGGKIGKGRMAIFLHGNRDMYLTSSVNQGMSFTPATRIGQGTWSLDACPMDGGMLMVNGTGVVETVWRRDGNIYMTAKSLPEDLLGRGQQPWVAATANGTCIVWTSEREGDLMLRAPSSPHAKKIGENARDPMVVSSANGKGSVVCCWEAKAGGDTKIIVQQIDAGE